MRSGDALVAIALAGVILITGCGDASTAAAACPSGQSCGFLDHKYFSTFVCSFGGGMGFSWRDLNHCGQECNSAAGFGCNATGCGAGCATDHGSGEWLPCTSANGGAERSDHCFLSGSGVNGETIPCVCR